MAGGSAKQWHRAAKIEGEKKAKIKRQ